MILYSLQGLGNSIVNYPILNALRANRPVRVVAFENGSAGFFRAHHDDVIGVRTAGELMVSAAGARVDESFVCAPTWRRELAAHWLTRAKVKHVLRPRGWTGVLTPRAPRPRPRIHDLENNLDLLGWAEPRSPRLAPEVNRVPGPRRLGVHPTASTELKYYPPAFWTALVNELAGDYDEVHVFCGPDPGEVEFARGLDPRARLHAGLDFGALTEALGNLTAFVGTDSAPMHLAAQLGRPTVGLWSYADFRRIHPYGDHAAIYVPRETLDATEFERPSARPAYLDRARATDVAAIVRGRAAADSHLARRFGPAVALHRY